MKDIAISDDRWVLFLQRFSAANAVRLSRALGLALYYGSLKSGEKKRYRKFYRMYLDVIGQQGDPCALTREFYATRPLMKYGAAIVSSATDEVVDGLVKVSGEEHIRAALAGGKGVVLASAHLGSGGLAAAWLARQAVRVLTVRRKELDAEEGTLHGRHALFGTEPMYIDPEESPAALLKRGMMALRQNAVISYLADGQFGARAAPATMFGREVQVRTGFVEVARLAGAPVVPAFGLAGRNGLRIEFHPQVIISNAEDVAAFPQKFATLHEAVLRDNSACLSWRPLERALFTGTKIEIHEPSMA